MNQHNLIALVQPRLYPTNFSTLRGQLESNGLLRRQCHLRQVIYQNKTLNPYKYRQSGHNQDPNPNPYGTMLRPMPSKQGRL